jgi:hypothetical protein
MGNVKIGLRDETNMQYKLQNIMCYILLYESVTGFSVLQDKSDKEPEIDTYRSSFRNRACHVKSQINIAFVLKADY